MIFLFHGSDTYSSTEKLNTWKKQFAQKYDGSLNIEVFQGDNLDLPAFITNLPSLPFLSEKKLVILRNFLEKGSKEDQKKLEETLKKLPESTVLIFHELKDCDKRLSLYKHLNKNHTVETFQEKSQPELLAWIIQTAKKKGLSLDSLLALDVINYAGTDLWKLSQELEKLSLLNNREQKIDKEMIEQVMSASPSSSIFKLTDELGNKQKNQALRTLNTLIQSGEEPGKIFYLLVGHFRNLLQIKDQIERGTSSRDLATKLKIHPFVAQKISSQSRNFALEELTLIYKKFLEIDRNLKTGKIRISKDDHTEYILAIERALI